SRAGVDREVMELMQDVASVTAASAAVSQQHAALHAPAPVVESLVPAPADQISTLWRESMMDPALSDECRAALAGKITANKVDYKEKSQKRHSQYGTAAAGTQ